MADEKLTNKIDAWLKGQLSEAEALAFQTAVNSDPSLAEEVELHQLTLRAMEHLSEQNLQQNVLAWIEDVNLEKDPKPLPIFSPYRSWFLAAAAILFLAVIFIFYQTRRATSEKQKMDKLEAAVNQRDSLLFELKQGQSTNPVKLDSLTRLNEQLQQQLLEARNIPKKPEGPMAYYSKPANLSGAVRMGEASLAEQAVKDGAVFFEKSDIKRAEDKARAALKIEPDNRDAIRLLAHTLFVQHRFLEAEAEFEKMQKAYAPSSLGATEAEWNRLLCFRALAADAGQKELFNAALNAILKDSKHPYHFKAKQMTVGD